MNLIAASKLTGSSILPASHDFKIYAMGERAWLIRLKLPVEVPSFKQLAQSDRYERLLIMRALERTIKQAISRGGPIKKLAEITLAEIDLELVTSYDSILVTFLQTKTPLLEFEQGHTSNTFKRQAVYDWLLELIELSVAEWHQAGGVALPTTGSLHRVGVSYGGEGGFDLEEMAHLNKLTPAALIQLHTATLYEVLVVGFAPGFAYLGNLPPHLQAPRRNQPRVKVPAGSVAIAAGLTAIYPFDLPGGWNVIGHTSFPLFDLSQQQPMRFLPGDQVQFYAL